MVDRVQRTNTTRVDTSRTRVNTAQRRTVKPEKYVCVAESCAVRHTNASNVRLAPERVPIGDIKHISDSITLNPKNQLARFYNGLNFGDYKVVANKGISYNKARDIDICLAKYAKKVAEEMDVSSQCYTGVKYTLWSAGVISDYADMPRGGACQAKNYFDAHPDKFEKLNISANDLKSLPAGVIIVYNKKGKDGHIAITNGKGQEMSDSTDNMGWLNKHGKGASFTAYKLTDNWQYNRETKKLEFHSPSNT